METICEPKPMVDDPGFAQQREKTLQGLSDGMIDGPILEIITGFNSLPCFFTLQCCYGHFLFEGRRDPDNLDPLPEVDPGSQVDYRIAYMAFCIENSAAGRKVKQALEGVVDVDSGNIQFCSAEWFWKKQRNTYALQVEPDRFKDRDRVMLDFAEAKRVEVNRNRFFRKLEEVLSELKP